MKDKKDYRVGLGDSAKNLYECYVACVSMTNRGKKVRICKTSIRLQARRFRVTEQEVRDAIKYFGDKK